MDSVTAWLPFKIDEAANQRSRKWETYPAGTTFVNTTGEVLDALPFIPKTIRYEQAQQGLSKISSMDNLERWFAQRIQVNGRNNQLLRYALALVDSGLVLADVLQKVKDFNSKLNPHLTVTELENTIFKTVAKHYTNTP